LLLESTQRKAAQLRAELAGPEPSRLERLLVEHIVSCWLQTNYADSAYAQLPKGANPAQHTAALQRQNSAQQRYLQAVKALATVRKLLRPAPSPLELLQAPVGETSPAPAATRRAGGLPRCGVAGIEN
jgi:hypothetical protein